MPSPSRPSFWRRLVGSSPATDFGDMGTAFGLDATMSPVSDWAAVGSSDKAPRANVMDEYESARERAPAAAGWPTWLVGKRAR